MSGWDCKTGQTAKRRRVAVELARISSSSTVQSSDSPRAFVDLLDDFCLVSRRAMCFCYWSADDGGRPSTSLLFWMRNSPRARRGLAGLHWGILLALDDLPL